MVLEYLPFFWFKGTSFLFTSNTRITWRFVFVVKSWSPLTRSLLTSSCMVCILMWPNLLCHSVGSSVIAFKPLKSWATISLIFKALTLSCLRVVMNISHVLGFLTTHFSLSKTTWLPLSHNWDTLKKFNFNPSTKQTLSMDLEEFLRTLPTPNILYLPLSPRVID